MILAGYVPAHFVTGIALFAISGTAHTASLAWVDHRLGLLLAHHDDHTHARAHRHTTADVALGASHRDGLDDSDHRMTLSSDPKISSRAHHAEQGPFASAPAVLPASTRGAALVGFCPDSLATSREGPPGKLGPTSIVILRI